MRTRDERETNTPWCGPQTRVNQVVQRAEEAELSGAQTNVVEFLALHIVGPCMLRENTLRVDTRKVDSRHESVY